MCVCKRLDLTSQHSHNNISYSIVKTNEQKIMDGYSITNYAIQTDLIVTTTV